MKIPIEETVVRPVTIPALARKMGVPRRTLFRRLLTMHGRDRAERPQFAGWLFRQSRGPWSVNLPRLRASHPEFFGVPGPEEMHEQLVELSDYARETRRHVSALAAAFREHRRVGHAVGTHVERLVIEARSNADPSAVTRARKPPAAG